MSPERTSPKGQFRTDWTRQEIGRIRVTYGYTLKEHQRAVDLLDELYDNHQYDVLRALKKKKGDPGRITVRELLAQKKAGRLRRDDVLVDLRIRRPLWSTLFAEAAKRPGGDKHRRRVEDALRHLQRAVTAAQLLTDEAAIADLVTLDWRQLRPAFASAADWNHALKAVRSCLTGLLGDTMHPFRREVLKAQGAKEKEPAHDVDVTVEQFWDLVAALPEHARAPVVTLAVTGMRLNTEYLRCTAASLRPASHSVYCPGSKTADAAGLIPVAESLWPWLEQGIPSPLKERWLRIYFHRAAVAVGLGAFVPDQSGKTAKNAAGEDEPVLVYEGLTLHDLRHLALQLALDGGAQLNDVQALARHADPAMTMRYLRRAGQRRAAEAIGSMLLPTSKRAQEG